MFIKIAVIILSLNIIFCFGKSVTLQPHFQTCSYSDPNFDQCYKNALHAAIATLKNGIPSLKVLPIDPMRISEMTMEQGSGPVSISLGLKNIILHGFSNVRYINVRSGINSNGNLTLWSEAEVPEINMISDYKVNGQILILPITGEGKSNITQKNVRVLTTMENEIVRKNGKEYLKNNIYTMKLQPKKIYFQLENLFGGDVRLGRQMNIFLNENSEDIFKEFGPVIEDAFGQVYKQISNTIFSQIPYKQIFMD